MQFEWQCSLSPALVRPASLPCKLAILHARGKTTLSLAAATLSLAGMEGTLFRYRTSPGSLQAFMSPAEHAHARYVIYLGGLTDGLLACSYVEVPGRRHSNTGPAHLQTG